MAAEESGENSELQHHGPSGKAAPKTFHGQMELVGGEEQRVTEKPTNEQLIHIASYQHRLHETRRKRPSDAVGAPSSFDERHPSVDARASSSTSAQSTTTKTETGHVSQSVADPKIADVSVSCPPSIAPQSTSSTASDSDTKVSKSGSDNAQRQAYYSYLAERYLSQDLGALSSTSFPSLTCKFFNLKIIKQEKYRRATKNIEASSIIMMKDIKLKKHQVKIEDILCKHENKRILVLIESVPGGGKSTLCLHMCQKWGQCKLFTKYDLVILVRLRDPEIQKASNIADLLPCRDDLMARQMADEIAANDGKNVLWILDGWDELPSNLQEKDSFFCAMINAPNRRKSQIPLSDIIVTSRPISSSKLQIVASSRFEILGFTDEQQEEYFEHCFVGETDKNTFQSFLEIVQDNPVLQSLCCVPQYAAYVANLYLCEGHASLTSEYDIFSAVIVNCVLQHFDKAGRTGDVEDIESINDLYKNKATKSSFTRLCKLAHKGVMNNQVSFSCSDLPRGFNHLGLLHGEESLASHGRIKVMYRFPNLSIQEVLAAYYIAFEIPENEHASQFNQLFQEPRFNAVFKFYASITKLKSPGIQEILINVIQEKNDSKIISLLHCLHEAQNDILCQRLAQELSGVLYLFGSPLSPLDLFVVGYLLSNICISISVHQGLTSVSGEFRVDLDNSQLGDQGCKSLVKGIQKYLKRDSAITSQAILELAGNSITVKGIAYITELLSQTTIISKLTLGHMLSGNPIESRGLQLISEALSVNKSLTELDLSNCSLQIMSENGPVLVKMLKSNKSLKCLLFRNTHIGDVGMTFIAEGMQHNKTVTALRLYNCGISASGARCIGNALKANRSLQLLNLSHNQIGGDGVKHVAEGLKLNDSLTTCVLDSCEINDEGFLSLVSAIIENTSIKSLWLEDNPAISNKKHVLKDALSKNKCMQKVVLPHQFLPDIIDIEVQVNENRKMLSLLPVELRVSDLSAQCMLVPTGLQGDEFTY